MGRQPLEEPHAPPKFITVPGTHVSCSSPQTSGGTQGLPLPTHAPSRQVSVSVQYNSSSQDKVKIYRNQHILDHDTWKSISGEVIHKEISLAEPLFVELQDFLSCLKNRSKPKADARAGVDSLKVVEAAIRSHEKGKEIILK